MYFTIKVINKDNASYQVINSVTKQVQSIWTKYFDAKQVERDLNRGIKC